MTSSLAYRPDIDGLRGIAVALVVFYHFSIGPFTGGFVGVDVFFVISGFLITGLVLQEIDRTGRIDLVDFFARRFRRLYPALFVILVASFISGFIIMGPEHFEALCASIVAAAIGTSNVYFWQTSGYFDANADLKPLLHTWSLGVEAQFYLVWPLFLLVIYRQGRRWAWLGVLGIGALSLWGSQHWLSDRSATFYLPQFRVFEFALGAVLAWKPSINLQSPLWTNVAAVVGIGLIITAAVLYDDKTPFPGTAAVLPTVGAALAMLASGGGRLVGGILRHPILVRLGKISYSIYLVHWPAFVFYKYFEFQELSGLQITALLIAVLSLSAALYRWIEKPLRRASSWGRVPLAVACTVLPLALMLPAGLSWAGRGLDFRTGGRVGHIAVGFDYCSYPMCQYGSSKQVDFVVVGDSHARHLYNGLKRLSEREGLSFAIFHFDPYCRFVNAPAKNEDRSYPCQDRLTAFLNFVAEHKVKRVLFAYRWRDVPEAAGVNNDVAVRTDDLLHDPHLSTVTGAAIVLNVPEFYENKSPQGCFVPPYLFPGKVRKCEAISEASSFYFRIRVLNATLARQFEGTGIMVLDPFSALCDGKVCYQKDTEGWLYADSHHLSNLGADRLIEFFSNRLLPFFRGEHVGQMVRDRSL